jgi:MoaA/NifB/PqqE/SkfB family radical SAM enzyme
MTSKKIKFCSLPWTELYNNSLGTYGMCCMEMKAESVPTITVDRSWQDHWNSDHMKTARQKFLHGGDLPECRACWVDEDAGKISMRNRRNQRYLGVVDPQLDNPVLSNILQNTDDTGATSLMPMALHFNVGSVCQLRCVTCSPSYSQSIFKDYKKLGWDQDFKNRRGFTWFDAKLDQGNLDKNLWPTLMELAPNVQWLHIGGGEPTISRPLMTFLQWCIDKDLAKNISIFLTTNSVNIKQEFIDLVQQFKLCIFSFSVDGIGALDEYIRYPTNWIKKEATIKKIAKQFPSSSVNTVVTSLNVNCLPSIVEWSVDNDLLLSFTTLVEPYNLSIHHMPDVMKNHARDSLNQLIEQINLMPDLVSTNLFDKKTYLLDGLAGLVKQLDIAGDPAQWQECLDIVKSYDSIRPKQLAQSNPHFVG